ncbi:hypothetical protein E1H18_2638 [Caulobacter sp. RHG1]|nr:hypothetical protein [Caulobacter sp. RHG1]
MSDDKGPFAVSRRAVIGAASAAPVVAGAGGGAAPDPAVARCAEWMALDAEIDRLGLRWSDLETILVRKKRWERMTPDERAALSPTHEMDAIDKQLEPLFEQRDAWLEASCCARQRHVRGRRQAGGGAAGHGPSAGRRLRPLQGDDGGAAHRALPILRGACLPTLTPPPPAAVLPTPTCGSQDRNGRCSPWSAWRASAGRDGAGQGRLRRRSARRPQGVPLTRASPSGPCSTKRSRASCLRAKVGDGCKLSGRPDRPGQAGSSAHASEADTLLSSDEKGVIAGAPPGLALYMARVRVGGVRPPLLTGRALGKHGAENALDLGEGQFEFVFTLAAQMTRQGIVLGHSPASPIDPDTSNLHATSANGERP